jgi:hypothetical protein
MPFSYDLKPNELIGIYYHVEEEYIGAPKSKTMYVPAISFLDLYNKQFRQEGRTAVDIALLMLGGAGIVGASTKLGKVIGILEAAFAVADITINEFRAEIAKSETGREFLRVWDIVSFIGGAYGITRIALKVPGAFSKLKDSLVKFKNSKHSLKPDEIAKLDNSVEGYLKKAKEAEVNAAQPPKPEGTQPKPSPEKAGTTKRSPSTKEEVKAPGAITPVKNSALKAQEMVARLRREGKEVVVNLGGEANPIRELPQWPDAINVNPKPRVRNVPNLVREPAEKIGDLFTGGSVDKVVARRLPLNPDSFDTVAQGIHKVLRKGGEVEINLYTGARNAEFKDALIRAGLREDQVKNISNVMFTATK